MLGEIWTCRTILLQSTLDSLGSVRGLYCRVEGLSKEVALYFFCKGGGVLLSTEGAFRISVDRYDTTWSGHLELEVGVVQHRIKSSECSSSEQSLQKNTLP